MNMTCHAFLQDKQIRKYLLFLLSCALLLIHMALLFSMWLTRAAGDLLLTHDRAVISSLLAQGIPEHTIAEALTSADTDHVQAAADLLARLGISRTKDASFWPPLHHYGNAALFSALSAVLLLCLLILAGTLVFLHKRASLYEQALKIVDGYQNGDYSRRLPQTEEGSLYHLFASVDRLATMQQAQRENERRSAIFLRNTISDISHQLKTPLAALSMYQEIMENEPDKPDVIRKFTAKTGTALRRMEELIQSMLKITRLDTGSIVFEKKLCPLTELVSHALSELTTRAEQEQKEILLNGSPDDTLLCDPAWTMEAIGNLVKMHWITQAPAASSASNGTRLPPLSESGSPMTETASCRKISIIFSNASTGVVNPWIHRVSAWDSRLPNRLWKDRAAPYPYTARPMSEPPSCCCLTDNIMFHTTAAKILPLLNRYPCLTKL